MVKVIDQYGSEYFGWQASVGKFGGVANLFKFKDFINETDSVLDFGCGGGFLLGGIAAREKFGVEVNDLANKDISENGIKRFVSTKDFISKHGEGTLDKIISNHALEHVEQPLVELIDLYQALKVGGKIRFVVPCESYKQSYNKADINHHLFTFSPQNLGNLFALAGFNVIECKVIFNKWPRYYLRIARLSFPFFRLVSWSNGHLNRTVTQISITAEK